MPVLSIIVMWAGRRGWAPTRKTASSDNTGAAQSLHYSYAHVAPWSASSRSKPILCYRLAKSHAEPKFCCTSWKPKLLGRVTRAVVVCHVAALQVRGFVSSTVQTDGSSRSKNDGELHELMLRYQAADLSAADELVRRLSPLLFRFLHSPQWIQAWNEDVLQDCWLQVHRARHTFRPGYPVLPWIFAIARHTRRDWYRRRCRIESREVPLQTAGSQYGFLAHSSTQDARLQPLLAVLPPSQRQVVVMLKISEMTLEEVAHATSSSVGSVKQRAYRAYRKLKEVFGAAASSEQGNSVSLADEL